MSEFKGTPGPWFISDDDSLVKRECSSKGYHFISTSSGFYSDKEDAGFEISGCLSIKDANLIAAAPELLEALQDALHAYDKHGEHSEWDFARSAVAKALGQ